MRVRYVARRRRRPLLVSGEAMVILSAMAETATANATKARSRSSIPETAAGQPRAISTPVTGGINSFVARLTTSTRYHAVVTGQDGKRPALYPPLLF